MKEHIMYLIFQSILHLNLFNFQFKLITFISALHRGAVKVFAKDIYLYYGNIMLCLIVQSPHVPSQLITRRCAEEQNYKTGHVLGLTYSLVVESKKKDNTLTNVRQDQRECNLNICQPI